MKIDTVEMIKTLKIQVLIYFIVGIQNCLIAQHLTYTMRYTHGFFSIDSTKNVKASDVSISLPTCACYSMQVLGGKITLGIEKYQDFLDNQNAVIAKYQEKVYALGYYDATVVYQIDKMEPSKIIFFYYETSISGNIPTGKFALSQGFYTVKIFKHELLEKEVAISIKNNTITKL